MINTSSLGHLANGVKGGVTAAGDAAYEGRREAFYGEFSERRPAAVVRPVDASDVSTAIAFAREEGLSLAVQGGGHSILGHSTSDGGVVIDLSSLKDVDIDVEGRSAWAGGGVLAGEYTAVAAEHGLATGFGDTPTVGVAGLTLGGGVGLLHRKLGLTLDNVLAAEVVTADGLVRQVHETSDPDLFWAIRGGGGNFGVVTRFRYRLHPIDEVVGGMLILPASPRVLADFAEIAESASEDFSAIIGVAVAPPLPFLPNEIHGRLIVMGMIAHAGDPEVAEKEVGRLRRLATPLVDGIDRVAYPALFQEEGGPPSPYAVAGRSFFSDEFTIDDAVATIDALEASTAPMSVVQIRVLGGAVATVPVDATAFAHRNRTMIVNAISGFEDTAARAEHEDWVSDVRGRLQHGDRGVYINFHGDDSETAVREAYPGATGKRLIDVKTKYDQSNLFSANHNIPPRS